MTKFDELFEVFINTPNNSEQFSSVSKQAVGSLISQMEAGEIGPLSGLKLLVEEILVPYHEAVGINDRVGSDFNLSELVEIYHSLDDIEGSTEWYLTSIEPPIKEGVIEGESLETFMADLRQSIVQECEKWLIGQK